MTAAPAVTLEAVRLSKRYGARTAVDGLSFTAREGDVLGLLGPNGAGKTTTIRLLTTVLTPTSGEFSVAGAPFTRPNEIRRRVGVLPESAGYPGHQTGSDFLRYHARLFGQARADAARSAERLLREVGLGERGATRISTYSRGMRQRLGIARALVNDPAVVFLDEPTLGLDPAGQRQVLGIVREVAQRRGATVVLSTHMLGEVEKVCTSVLILDRGKVLASGTLAEVTAAVTASRTAHLRVPADLAGRTRKVLGGVPGLTVEPVGDRPDLLTIVTTGRPDPRRNGSDPALNAGLRAVLGADVPVLAFEVQGGRLSDAFLSVTGESVRGESTTGKAWAGELVAGEPTTGERA